MLHRILVQLDGMATLQEHFIVNAGGAQTGIEMGVGVPLEAAPK